MLSGKLIHLIEAHHKEINDRIMRELWRNPDLEHLRRLPESEMRERAQGILENLGYWLAAGNSEELAKQQEAIGKKRFEQSVPLHESVLALCILKEKMIDFIEEQGIPRDALAVYAEEEMEHRMGRFFDIMIIQMVRGYENAWRKAASIAA